ncbi:MAG: outer membrane lipoprotein-sorting protein [Deltaproteobacteria bacterium]|nr:outer membrane lipoprotein-sorting protein [Deltaproteobacteria bacterium]
MKKLTKWIATVVLVGVPLLVSNAWGEELSVREIVEKANLAAYYGGDDGRSTVRMTISDSQGRTRNREFVILRRDVVDGGAQTFYVYFKKPSDVRKMVFMVHKHIDKDDDRWLYLPALDLVKRIASSDKRTSFVGSHFFYEDVSGRSIEADNHELIEVTDTHYVIKNTPKDSDSVEFSSYTIWIDKETFIPERAVYLNKQGQEYRMVEALAVDNFQGIPTVMKSRARDLASGGETVSEFSDIHYNLGLEEKLFTERYLRRAPKQVR